MNDLGYETEFICVKSEGLVIRRLSNIQDYSVSNRAETITVIAVIASPEVFPILDKVFHMHTNSFVSSMKHISPLLR